MRMQIKQSSNTFSSIKTDNISLTAKEKRVCMKCRHIAGNKQYLALRTGYTCSALSGS